MASENAGEGSTPDRLPLPSLNPIPLSATQEAQVRAIYYQRVRRHCADEIQAFAACAAGRTFTVSFACRDHNRAMNGCLKRHASQAEEDAAREEWFAQRPQRQRERERRERKKAQQEDFLREWWGLPEKDAAARRGEEERLVKAERVGGFASRDKDGEGKEQGKGQGSR